jgi:hypothetical protein
MKHNVTGMDMADDGKKRFVLDEKACRDIVRQTVHETLLGIGFEMTEPHKLQADMHYLRKLRSGSEDMMRVVQRSAIALSCTTALYLLWDAVKTLLMQR